MMINLSLHHSPNTASSFTVYHLKAQLVADLAPKLLLFSENRYVDFTIASSIFIIEDCPNFFLWLIHSFVSSIILLLILCLFSSWKINFELIPS